MSKSSTPVRRVNTTAPKTARVAAQRSLRPRDRRRANAVRTGCEPGWYAIRRAASISLVASRPAFLACGGARAVRAHFPGRLLRHANASRRVDLALVGAALVAAALLLAVFRAFTVDDAFITYRHARNLAHGHGAVPNPGELVEGVSNLPW